MHALVQYCWRPNCKALRAPKTPRSTICDFFNNIPMKSNGQSCGHGKSGFVRLPISLDPLHLLVTMHTIQAGFHTILHCGTWGEEPLYFMLALEGFAPWVQNPKMISFYSYFHGFSSVYIFHSKHRRDLWRIQSRMKRMQKLSSLVQQMFNYLIHLSCQKVPRQVHLIWYGALLMIGRIKTTTMSGISDRPRKKIQACVRWWLMSGLQTVDLSSWFVVLMRRGLCDKEWKIVKTFIHIEENKPNECLRRNKSEPVLPGLCCRVCGVSQSFDTLIYFDANNPGKRICPQHSTRGATTWPGMSGMTSTVCFHAECHPQHARLGHPDHCRPCANFTKGFCRKGDECNYCHLHTSRLRNMRPPKWRRELNTAWAGPDSGEERSEDHTRPQLRICVRVIRVVWSAAFLLWYSFDLGSTVLLFLKNSGSGPTERWCCTLFA